MITNKIIIGGTGRSGTSFLMHILTNLGFNTGYSSEEALNQINRHKELNAGIEHPIEGVRTEESYIVKNPSFSFPANLEKINFNIEHFYIPIRDIESSAKSRELMSKVAWKGYGGFNCATPSVDAQQKFNAMTIYNLVDYLEYNEIDFSFLSFPKLVFDSKYLFSKLNYILSKKSISYSNFKKEFDLIADSGKVRFERA